MWATRPHLANIFEKLLDQKTFSCLRLVIGNTTLRKNNLSRPAKGGSTPAFACGLFLTTNIIFTAMLKPLQKKAPDITPTPIRTESNLLHAAPIRQSPSALPSNFPAALAVTPAVTFPPLRYANLPPSERQSLPQELASFVRKSPFGNSQPHFPEQCHYHKSVLYILAVPMLHTQEHQSPPHIPALSFHRLPPIVLPTPYPSAPSHL